MSAAAGQSFADRWYRMAEGPDGKPRKVPAGRHGTGTWWAARWRDANGRQRYRTFERRLDADNFLARLRADLMRGSYIDPREGKVTGRRASRPVGRVLSCPDS